ncbi:twin-arginine translocation signal domain-containing protein [Natronomonas marina]|uniref:twin-arginine translocation signal domain-containing protein n=1 Tax=Natronomonas marina TaxID=2961939 RepID=UPI0020C94DD7|nr:twin-arginine translocation signal domain-containing protein [Natronomonas marina]
MSEHNPDEFDDHDGTPDDYDEAQLYETTGPTTSRRGFLKAAGAAAGAAATGSYYGSPVQQAEAIGFTTPDDIRNSAAANAIGAVMGKVSEYGGFDLAFWTDDASKVEEQTADLVHQNAYRSVVNAVDMQRIFIDTLRDETGVSADRPKAGGLGAIAWSKIRAETFRGRKDGKTVAETTSNVQSELNEYISTVLKDFYARWNEFASQIEQNRYMVWRAAASNDSLSETDIWSANPSDSAYNPAWDGNSTYSFGAPGSEPPAFSDTRSLYSEELPNGDTVDIRVMHSAFATDSNAYSPYVYWPGAPAHFDDASNPIGGLKRFGPQVTNSDFNSSNFNLWSSEDSIVVAPSSDGENVTLYDQSTWNDIRSAILDFYTRVSGEIQSYVQTVFDNYTADNVGEILTGQDIRREFADDEMGAAVAEYIAMGYAGDDVDLGTTVRVSADTSNTEDGVTEEVEGVMLMDIPEDTLATWEFSIKSSTLTINDASLRDEYRSEGDDRTYTVVYDDGSGGEATEQVTAGSDFAEGDSVELSNATQSTLIRVERDTENWDGDIATAISEGTTISASDYRNARMVYTDENDRVQRIELGGDIDLLEVVEENRSEVVYTAWVNVTSDPTISKQEMNKLLDAQQEIIEELSEENNSGGIAGFFDGTGSIPLWAPGGIIAAAIAYALTDDD